MEKTKEMTLKELLDSIRGNRYAQHKAEIHKISQEGNDVGVSCDILRTRMGWEFPDGDQDISAFNDFVVNLQRMSDIDHNYVLDYFEGRLD